MLLQCSKIKPVVVGCRTCLQRAQHLRTQFWFHDDAKQGQQFRLRRDGEDKLLRIEEYE